MLCSSTATSRSASRFIPDIAGSMRNLEDPAPAALERPAPEGERRLAFLDVEREEDALRAADEILERHVSDAPHCFWHAGIGRVVAIVAHHEEVVGRDDEELGVVVDAAVALD